jgi:hypothetical protein
MRAVTAVVQGRDVLRKQTEPFFFQGVVNALDPRHFAEAMQQFGVARIVN